MSAYTRGKALEESVSQGMEPPESPTKQQEKRLEKALHMLTHLDKTTSLRGNIQFHLTLDNLIQVAMSHGLSQDQLTTLITVIGSQNPKLTQVIRCKLVKCLIPSYKVPQAAVVKVFHIIAANVLANPTNLHSLLLRWVLLVFDHLDGYDRLHRLYGLVFSFIDSVRLLPHACQLLFLLTRREDVVLFRVQKLLDLIRLQGPEPCIMGLLMIYKVYCPHLVTIRLNYGNKVFFKNHDSTWRATIEAVVGQARAGEHWEEKDEDVRTAEKRRERVQRRRGAKRQKLIVPDVHAAMQEVEEEEDLPDEHTHTTSARVPYVQIDTFTSFLENLDKIEYPSQVSAVLQDSQLQLLMMCDPDPVAMARLSLWIQHLFAFGFKKTDEESKQNEELLKMLLHFAQNVQGLPVLEAFLCNYLPTWDGRRYAPVILCLISCLKPSTGGWDELYFDILQPVLRLYYSSDVYLKVGLVSSLTKLLHNWATLFSQSEKSATTASAAISKSKPSSSKGEGQAEASKSVLSEDSAREADRSSVREADQSSVRDLIIYLIKCLDTALVLGLRMEGDHLLLQRAALEFVEKISELYSKFSLPLICFPTRLFYRLLLSDCPATLALVCSCVNMFRSSITTLREAGQRSAGQSMQYMLFDTVSSFPTHGDDVGQSPGSVSHKLGLDAFNSVLLDVMGILWQGRMFSQRKRLHSSMCMDYRLPKHIEPTLHSKALTVFQGPAFLGLAYKFLSEAQGTESKVHPTQIEKFKEIYLQFLDREGFPQFKELVDMNLKSRKPAEQGFEDSVRP
ncbi:centromere protein i [Plakobranchus ocellatus]|uniref:Centromere protein i n=1 Tax=Plakobranchus ocellatus TaxID=259542 RepID=A0AAV3YNL3_9GAST|nr:centromere protein i [Plakobranchus ocellatus]